MIGISEENFRNRFTNRHLFLCRLRSMADI